MKKLFIAFTLTLFYLSTFSQDAFLGAHIGGSSSSVDGQNYMASPKRSLHVLGGLSFTIVHKSGFYYGLEATYDQKGFSNSDPTFINDIVYEGEKTWNFDYVGGSLKMGYVHGRRKHRVFGNVLGTYNYLLTTNAEVLAQDNLGNFTEIAIPNELNTKEYDVLIGLGGGYSTSIADRIAGSIELRWTGSVVDHYIDSQDLLNGYHTAFQLLVGVKIPLERKNACDLCP